MRKQGWSTVPADQHGDQQQDRTQEHQQHRCCDRIKHPFCDAGRPPPQVVAHAQQRHFVGKEVRHIGAMQGHTSHGGDDADVGHAPLGELAQPELALFRLGVLQGDDPLHAGLLGNRRELIQAESRMGLRRGGMFGPARIDKAQDMQSHFGL